MPARRFLPAPAVAALACALVAGCTAVRGPGPAHRSGAPPDAVSGARGSPANPLLLACAQEAISQSPVPRHPGPHDLAIGPLYIVNGKALAAWKPSYYGYRSYGKHGRAYKIPLVLAPGLTATVTIGAPARGRVVIDNPYAHMLGIRTLVAASYRSCAHRTGFFAQGFAFTHGPARGCVPLEVRIGGQPRVRHVTLSLFAGSCAAA